MYTFKIWLLINFKSLELKQSYIPHLKVLVCGINASTSQWYGCIFILCYTHLKLALLLHKQGLVATGVATIVHALLYRLLQTCCYIWNLTCKWVYASTNVFYIFHEIFEMNIFTDFQETNASKKNFFSANIICKKNVHWYCSWSVRLFVCPCFIDSRTRIDKIYDKTKF